MNDRVCNMTMVLSVWLAVAVMLTGCATLRRSEARSTEQLLAAAGFVMRPADAAEPQPGLAAMPSSQPDYLTIGPDGHVWFTEFGAGRVGEVTASGAVIDYALFGPSTPEGIAEGPDNRLWIADWGTWGLWW